MVNYFPEWVAGLNQNHWQVISGMGGSFKPESAQMHNQINFAKRTLTYLIGIFFLIFVFSLIYKYYIPANNAEMLSLPTLSHWFGTDVTGRDIFLQSINALFIAILTLAIVSPIIYLCGLFIGLTLSYFDSAKSREFLLNLVHFWVTLPTLLIAIFLLILVGAGQLNVIVVLILVLVPSQALYAYNQLEEAKKQDFVLAKKSYGFSKYYIFRKHIFPYIGNSYRTYSFSRMPEILMMDLAFNFLGLGVQQPNSSFGRMLFDGLSFMFAAWWMWVFVIILVSLLFILINEITNINNKA